ncbi:hypothetical protein RHSIM_Rhsim06G0190200 [Rhododendron simsii]|uniref:Uncharacterized protein n=1 Tax=Rhododendron simsii TaxID=118357 RepID=A0A834LLW5_RHOSS|nr:hypothetical protein RHSIM_Rhsim06G0190200 [Rhododendron simsii]
MTYLKPVNHYMKKGISRHLKTGTGVTGACTSALPPTPRSVIASVVSLYCIAYSMVLLLLDVRAWNVLLLGSCIGFVRCFLWSVDHVFTMLPLLAWIFILDIPSVEF